MSASCFYCAWQVHAVFGWDNNCRYQFYTEKIVELGWAFYAGIYPYEQLFVETALNLFNFLGSECISNEIQKEDLFILREDFRGELKWKD